MAVGDVRYFKRVLLSEVDNYDFTAAHIHRIPSMEEPVALIDLDRPMEPITGGESKRNGSKGKERWSLIPWRAMREVVKAFTAGAEKHDRDGKIGYLTANPVDYFDAAMRHISEYQCGVRTDHETQLHPLAHAAASLLIVIWHELKE